MWFRTMLEGMDGHELKVRRVRLRMSQLQLARRLGVNQETISRWETGEVKIRHPVILLLAMRYLEWAEATARDGEDGAS